MKKLFERNIFVDYLTKLPNFFKFVESDVNIIFGDQGTIIILDMIGFENINKSYGREVGDICLKTLAKAINKNIDKYSNSSAFRTDGDEFTIVLPKLSKLAGEQIAKEIKKDFREAISAEGFVDIKFRSLILEFNHKINSINELYQIIFEHSLEKLRCNDEKFIQERWMKHIIGSFTSRIKETLSFFNDAYNLALTDDVSGLPNNRAAKIYLSNLINENKTDKFSILFIDGDNLKRYNSISYKDGNEMIEKLSIILQGSLRQEDRVFRWLSGDEFVVVLKNLNCEDTTKLAERIRKNVEKETKNWIYPITVSIGISSYPEDGHNIQEIIDGAERANLIAKSSGKNKVVRWNDDKEQLSIG